MAKLLSALGRETDVVLNFARGEHHRASETRIPDGYARRIVNFDATASGLLVTRPGFTPTGFPGGHSMFTTSNGTTFYVSNGMLVKAGDGFTVPVVDRFGQTIPVAGKRLWWVEVNGMAYYSNALCSGAIDESGRRRPVGVPNPVAQVVDTSKEQFTAVAWVDDRGEESGAVRYDGDLSFLVDNVVNLGYKLRVYRTAENSELFTRVAVGTDQYSGYDRDLHAGATGAPLKTLGLVPLPPVKYLTLAKGRLIGAIGSTLVYSNALRYNLYDPAYNTIDLPAAITAVGAVEDGIYVGTAGGLWFLSGDDLDNAQLALVDGAPVYADSQCYVDAQALPADALGVPVNLLRGKLFAWVNPGGVGFGFAGGVTRTPTQSYLSIPPTVNPCVSVVERDGYTQLVIVVESDLRETSVVADSLMNNSLE